MHVSRKSCCDCIGYCDSGASENIGGKFSLRS
nr:MAG TPA: Cysteine/serine-rich nuclear protein [Caudoviricetes sp.]